MDAHNFLHHIFRSMVQPQQNEDDGMDEMPPLEPIVPIETPQRNSQSTPASTETTMPINPNPIETQGSSTERINYEDGDDSMPELQSVSDSSDEGNDSDEDANEVEMQAVEDDNDSSWVDEEDSGVSVLDAMSVPTSNRAQHRPNRRPRVDEDEDDERDRRHPSQRVGNVINPQPVASSSPAPTLPAPQPGPNVPPPPVLPLPVPRGRATINVPGFLGTPGAPDPLRLFQHRMFRDQNRNSQPPNPNPANDLPQPGATVPVFGGFAITLDMNGTPVLHHHANTDFAQDFAAFREFAGFFGLGFSNGEIEDPERAKRLIDGLEVVPVGLVRRLERVGGRSTAEEEIGGSGGDSGCAICWDRLLDGESDGFESADTSKPESSGGSGSEFQTSISAPPTVGVEASAQPSVSSSKTTEETYPKIVSLPCAHVFHASCLIPWFSRPNQTTCPTCRFNIDPENLTFNRRRPTPPSNTARPTTNNDQLAAGNPQPAATTTSAGPSTAAGEAQVQMNNTDENADRAQDIPLPEEREAELVITTEPQRGTGPTLLVNATAGPSGTTNTDVAAPGEPVTDNRELMDVDLSTQPAQLHESIGQEEFAGPLLPFLNGVDTAAAPMQSEAPNANADANGLAGNLIPTQGFVTFGFDVFIGPTLPGMGMGPMGMDMDTDMEEGEDFTNEEMEQALGEMFPNMAPPAAPNQHRHPQNTTATNARTSPFPTPTNGTPFAPLHRQNHMFPGMTTGPGVHIGGGIGTARSMNDVLTTIFGGGGGALGQPPGGQGIPAATGATPSNPPPATPTSGGLNASQNPQQDGNPNTGNRQHIPDFFSTLLNNIPAGALGRIIPMPMGGAQTHVNDGNAMAPNPAPPPTTQNFNAQSALNLPPLNPGEGTGNQDPTTNGPPNSPPQNTLPPFANLFGGFPANAFRPRAGNNPPPFASRPPRERKQWTLPPAPGPTLRQRIERKEREAGLRCYDVSCGVGPSDDEPYTTLSDAAMKQLSIRPHQLADADADVCVCSHTFHSPCLVSSERVSLKGAEVNVIGNHVEVSCSICRGVGRVLKADWDEGVEALA